MAERHESCCATNNAPAYEPGPCDCKLSLRVSSQAEGNPHGYDEIIVCAGPPLCHAENGAIRAAANNGCTDCLHIVVHPDGNETEYRLKAN